MAIVRELHVDGFHTPAGPPERNAMNVVQGRAALVAGALSEVVTGKVPATAGLYVNFADAPLADTGALSIQFVAGPPDRIVVGCTNALNVNIVNWRAEW